MEMLEMFEEEFAAVYEAHDCSGWWEVFDSELWEEVQARIVSRCGAGALEAQEFIDWAEGMAGDL